MIAVVSTVHVPSLLSRLKSPAPSDLSRKRKLKTNPLKGMKHGEGAVTAESSVHPTAQELVSFPMKTFLW